MPTPPPGANAPTVEEFLRAVLRSGLLDREALQQAVRQAPRPVRHDPRALADHLVRSGRLSRFQAGKLLKGAALGLLLGPFQVLAPIGRGGMATVYLARDGRSGQLVALKVLSRRKASREPRRLARFQREMELSRLVAHPNLAWTYEVGQWRGIYYLALEFIPGKNLAQVLAEQGPLPVPRAARLIAEAATGLEHAHRQGLIHRDLKPSNIMVTPNDHAKVLDLGLALVRGEEAIDQTVMGGNRYIVGTMDYIAPEQTEDALAVDARADVYGLGCTLYYALTGHPPFPGGSSRDKAHRHRTEEASPLAVLRPDVPAGFAAVVREMMAKDPEERYPSAAAVAEALRPWGGANPLPVDRPDDPRYAEALAALQEAEPSSEFTLPELVAPADGREAEGAAASAGPPAGQGWSVPLLVSLLVTLLALATLSAVLAVALSRIK